MTNLKELAHKYYKEMSSDSKRKSAEAERKLCKILNHVITKMEKNRRCGQKIAFKPHETRLSKLLKNKI